MLLDLPPEIFNQIINEKSHIRTLKNLAEASKALHRHLLPLLHRDFRISFRNNDVTQIHIPGFVKTYFKEDGTKDIVNCLKFAKNVEIGRRHQLAATTISGLCQYVQIPVGAGLMIETEIRTKADQIHWDNMVRTGRQIISALLYIPKNSLEKFSWNISLCEPPDIFGSAGYLLTHQSRHIKAIELNGNSYCRCHSPPEVLSELKHLRHLSWVVHPWNAESNRLMNGLYHSIESLELSSFSQEPMYMLLSRQPLYFLFDQSARWLRLRSLSLNYLWFGPFVHDMGLLTVIGQLRSLKLLHCAYTLFFLEEVVKQNIVVRLKSFEIGLSEMAELVVFRGDAQTTPQKVLEDFLLSFDGLEELYIWGLIQRPGSPRVTLENGILNHKSTLRRLVHHWRALVDDESNTHTWICEHPLRWHKCADMVLQNLNLVCFGFTMVPYLLVC
ncbi:hypothetical protein AJ79_00611 [Helicocarpus griseus UAMH5409]|uniref:F-box domain-containing protein n=1 Tax=Helicocarpus griseus UAMH5409 TaxID=1447875 RepID=A0A2B7YBM6_9EURO|nr:hypothetical protein AJ79_00611 [Helicocarpus griseus UAMH5409]